MGVLNFPKTSLDLWARRTELTNLIANFTSPGLLDATFFAF